MAAPISASLSARAPHGAGAAGGSWTVPAELDARPIDRVLHDLLGISWSKARDLVTSGKTQVSGKVVCAPTRPVRAGEAVEVRLSAPRPSTTRAADLEARLIAYLDKHVVVVRKPAGVSTVPFGYEPTDEVTLDVIVQRVLGQRDSSRGRASVGVVQRLDKATSGLLVFARSFSAKKHLAQQLRLHTMGRRYVAIAHGVVPSGTYRSYLIKDRGDGLRGSATERKNEGQLAVTHVEQLEVLAGATLVSCRLETGRTHQIRIHLAEAGHPLVGEEVYCRDYRGLRIPAPRLMLHSAELHFAHPADDRPMRFEEPPPSDFAAVLDRLRGAG